MSAKDEISALEVEEKRLIKNMAMILTRLSALRSSRLPTVLKISNFQDIFNDLERKMRDYNESKIIPLKQYLRVKEEIQTVNLLLTSSRKSLSETDRIIAQQEAEYGIQESRLAQNQLKQQKYGQLWGIAGERLDWQGDA